MTSHAYYLTTLAAWQRERHRFAHSHFTATEPISQTPLTGALGALPAPQAPLAGDLGALPAPQAPLTGDLGALPAPKAPLTGEPPGALPAPQAPVACLPGGPGPCLPQAGLGAPSAAYDLEIVVLVEADEATHLALENSSDWTPLPHPLSLKPVGEGIAARLAGHGIAAHHTVLDVAERLARTHPLLFQRLF